MFCTVIVNTLLIAGIFVSSSRRSSESKVVSPSPEADKTNVPSAKYSAKERSIILQRGGERVLPYITSTGMCRPTGS